jgi:V/A-type H+-transporting ATPase subunit I
MVGRMSSVEVVGPLRHFEAAVNAVQEAGVLHVEEIPLAGGEERRFLHRIHLTEEQAEEQELLRQLVQMLEEGIDRIPGDARRQLRNAPAVLSTYQDWERQGTESLAAQARQLHARNRAFLRRERNLEDDLQVLGSYEQAVAALTPLVEKEQLPQDQEYLGVIFERRSGLARQALRRELQRLTGGAFRLYEASLPRGRSAALIGVPPRHAQAVRESVAAVGVPEMNLPRHLRDRPFEEALLTLEDNLAELRHKRQEVHRQAEHFYREKARDLLAMAQVCRDRLVRFETQGKFARTRYAFIMRGWVLRSQAAALASALRENVGQTVLVRPVAPREMGRPPVVLENPRAVRSFEPLLSLLPLPRYGTIDPTAFLATFFPPMFGLMLGDVGYGVLIGLGAALLYLLGRRHKLVASLSVVVALCAFFTIVFGFVFGELFGNLGHQLLGLRPLWQERFVLTGGDNARALLGYLAIAVAIGVVHVLLGLVLGVINARRSRDRHGMLENLARIAGLFMLFFFVGRLVRVLPPVFTTLGVASLVAFLVIMVYHTVRQPVFGLLLPLELLSALGNILSYARIMAIGLASVVLALLANLFGGLMGSVVLGVIIVVLVHAMNLLLGIVDPTIQGLRLHYVEFFSKFYQSGGKRFAPLRKIGGLTV